jgi:hypothetical protein
LIDLIQKFRLSDSTIDHNYSLNSVDVIINGGQAGSHISCLSDYQGRCPDFVTPPTHSSCQFVWMPKESYVKPSSGIGTKQDARSHQQDRYRDKGSGRDRSSRGDKSYRGDKTCPNGTGTIVLVGTLQIRCQKGVIGNGTVHQCRVIIKLQA